MFSLPFRGLPLEALSDQTMLVFAGPGNVDSSNYPMMRAAQIMPARLAHQGTQDIKFIQAFNPQSPHPLI
jgi:hypothetical protein